MKRIFSVLLAALLAGFAGYALAEDGWETADEPLPGDVPAAACAHEHTETLYYFDYPVYTAVDGESHAVSGEAAVNVVCQDCGAVLSSTVEENAVEIRPHAFRNGRCALCGYESAPQQNSAPAPAEEEDMVPSDSPDAPGENFVTLTGRDLEQAGNPLVLRTGDRGAALVVQTQQLREEMERTGGFMIAEIVKQDDRRISTFIRLYDDGGAETVPGGQVVSIRVYHGNGGSPVRVSYTGPDGTTSSGEAGWVEGDGGESYWSVPWLGNGIYELIR